MKVMDNKLFSIDPQQGKLEPGECKTVSFTYRHTMAGTDRLPVLLKLARGREILVKATFCHARLLFETNVASINSMKNKIQGRWEFWQKCYKNVLIYYTPTNFRV